VNAVLFSWLRRLVSDFASIFIGEVFLEEIYDNWVEKVVEHLGKVNLISGSAFSLINADKMLLLRQAVAVEVRNGVGVLNDALNIIGDVVETKEVPPALGIYVLEDHVGANVRLVAAHDTRRQDATIRLHIAQCDVMNIDERLGLAGNQRVKHAARATATRLMLLLWANVNGPPDRTVDHDVVVKDIGNASA